jgi:serine/threonine protein kinase
VLGATPQQPISKFTLIEHEGLLKLRTVPFRNSMQVSTSPCLFMEKADISLASLLEDRYNSTKLFTEEDLINLLESTLYTLAYLETKGIVYKDLSTDNLYYDPE